MDAQNSRVAIACQGGGSHTAFSGGVLQGLMKDLPKDVEIVAISGTSGGAMCAALAWEGFVRNDLELGGQKLQKFWDEIGANELWDKIINQSILNLMALRNHMVLPEVSPYTLPTWGEEIFRHILNRHFNFEELRRLAHRPGAPALLIGAVEVLTGHFEVFKGDELSVECLMASAAIPELYRAVVVPDRGVYWDGLFSQNPPIHDLTKYRINELWLIQINSTSCPKVPTETHEISDRRNRLAGNLSMEQELRQIEMINRLIAQGVITDPKFRPVYISRISMDRELDFTSKMDRRPDFLKELGDFGKAKARIFLKEREKKKYTLKALGVLK